MIRCLFARFSARCRRWVEAIYTFDDRLYERLQASPVFVIVLAAMTEACVLMLGAVLWIALAGFPAQRTVPVIVIAMTAGLGVALRVRLRTVRAALVEQRLKAGLCPACGYDLRSTPDRCPECVALPRFRPDRHR